jgi:hexosaminidase
MKRFTLALILALAIPAAAVDGPPTLNLMPVPAQLELGEAAIEIGPDFTVTIEGDGATPRLRGGVRRMLRRLSDRSAFFFEPSTFLHIEGRSMASMVVTASRKGELVLDEDESYRLTITSDGIALQALTDIGALRGLETFLQLVTLDERGVTVPEIAIFDKPRFPWRGLMIDSSRHFMPVETIKRNLDGMSAVKLNVLHWHLVDDQGFRVECLAWPKLHEEASDGQYYTRAQIRDVIAYAAERGIRVVPEFDLPGHATAWLTGYPELGSAPGPYEIEREWGIHDPTVNPIIEKSYEFLAVFFAEMAELFDDEFMHIGGDENNGKHWLANPDIVAFMEEHGSADVLSLQRYFNQRMLEIFTRYGKRMVGWDEIFQEGLPRNVVIQSWHGRESLFESARLGYSGILSNGYYIDLMQPTDFHYLNDPQPADSGLTAEEAARILGGEATMWAEYVSPATVDSRIWPRTAAIAERLWSPGRVRDLDDMYRRIDRISLMLEELGLQHERSRPMMLRRLCQCRDIAALEVLLGAIEPVKVYNRGRLRKHTQFSPLTRMVDAAWADADPAREFRWAVERLIESDFLDHDGFDVVRTALVSWRDNHEALEDTLRTSPALADIVPMSIALTEVSTIGLDALDRSPADDGATREWLELRLDVLNARRESHGQTELMIIDPVVDLVCAVALPASLTVDGCQEKEINVVGAED